MDGFLGGRLLDGYLGGRLLDEDLGGRLLDGGRILGWGGSFGGVRNLLNLLGGWSSLLAIPKLILTLKPTVNVNIFFHHLNMLTLTRSRIQTPTTFTTESLKVTEFYKSRPLRAVRATL